MYPSKSRTNDDKSYLLREKSQNESYKKKYSDILKSRETIEDQYIKKNKSDEDIRLDKMKKDLYNQKPECLIIRDFNNLVKKLNEYADNSDNNDIKDKITSVIFDLNKIHTNITKTFNDTRNSIGDDLYIVEDNFSAKPCHKYPNCTNCTACWFLHLQKLK
jgi:hypothetical protein